jgi:RND superfamily putative drug exporter
VSPPVKLGSDLWEIQAELKAEPLSTLAQDTLRAIRAVPAPYQVQATGQTAQFRALQDSLGSHLPIAIGVIVLTTLLILFAMTGSVVLPVKALVMNALTLSAAFGTLVFIFQNGHFEKLVGFTSQGALESTSPIILFALVFGLSTDYSVFLLGRIKEGFDEGLTSREAVAAGLEKTGRIVTLAAALLCIAVGALALSRLTFVKELGLGTAVAVFIDASLVRAVLVPSLMAIMGRGNWWAPGPLRRLHTALHLDHLESHQSATPLAKSEATATY